MKRAGFTKRIFVLILLYVFVFFYKLFPVFWNNSSRVNKRVILHGDQIPNNLIDSYYRTNYGSCQHSVIKENSINCRRLIENTTISKLIPVSKSRKCELNKITKNCKLFRQINGYEDKVVTKLEEDFPLAFGIRLHKSAEPIEQILRIIYRPHNFYCIHVDNGSDIRVFNSLRSVARCFDNVVVLSQIRTVYSSIRLVEADLLCMKEAMKSTIQWKYFLNMVGQELPLKTNLEIVQICQILQGRNDIESEPANEVLMNRMKYEHTFTKYRLIKTGIPKKPFAPKSFFRKGSAYGTFSRGFVGFVLSSDIAKDLMEFLKNVWAPEETFFNTLNSVEGAPGGYNISVKHGTFDFISREEIWKWDPVVCNGLFYKDICIFNNRDLPWLVKQPEIIANKMEGSYDQVVIDCIEEYLYNKSLQADIFALNKTHYKQYPHTKDLYKTT